MHLGKQIAHYRKNKNITQETLAKLLGISNQAVSKCENEQSYPDIELLPKLADIFEITLDVLFERNNLPPNLTAQSPSIQTPDIADSSIITETESASADLPDTSEVSSQQAQAPTEKPSASQPQATAQEASPAQPPLYAQLPWKNDKTLRFVLFQGHNLIQQAELKKRFGKICNDVSFHICGPALNVESYFNVICEDVSGYVTAGNYVECEDVGQHITAGNYVICEDVGQYVCAGGYVECNDVGHNVSAGSYVECGDVNGDVKAGGCVECGDVHGNVHAEENVECGDVGGNITAGGKML